MKGPGRDAKRTGEKRGFSCATTLVERPFPRFARWLDLIPSHTEVALLAGKFYFVAH